VLIFGNRDGKLVPLEPLYWSGFVVAGVDDLRTPVPAASPSSALP
jgi:hypothetical protein